MIKYVSASHLLYKLTFAFFRGDQIKLIHSNCCKKCKQINRFAPIWCCIYMNILFSSSTAAYQSNSMRLVLLFRYSRALKYTSPKYRTQFISTHIFKCNKFNVPLLVRPISKYSINNKNYTTFNRPMSLNPQQPRWIHSHKHILLTHSSSKSN